MTLPPERESLGRMQQLFAAVAPRYNFVTRAFSYGMDQRWKRFAVSHANLPRKAQILDLGCGTADFSRLLGSNTVACDLTFQMLSRARRVTPLLVNSDAMRLPFRDQTFHAVFAGYSVRNFPLHAGALTEVARILKPGGCLVTLDFFLPANPLYRRLFLAYMFLQGFFWGTLLHANPRIYTYIPDSLRCFFTSDEFDQLLSQAGFTSLRRRQWLLGAIAVHFATLPKDTQS
jgi:demethylmenaquinone methyltransferase / 2-methoxy-6-polyprenyl-1,4-benzoquinol methylase